MKKKNKAENIPTPKLPHAHFEEHIVAAAHTTLTLSKAALVMVGDIVESLWKGFHPHPYYHAFCEHRKESFRSTLNRLEQEGYIGTIFKDGVKEYYLTQKGKAKRDIALRDVFLKAAFNESWDGKWRIIIFDIPEKIRKRRDFLRVELRAFGFIQLQKSVWVTPYKVDKEFSRVIKSLDMDKYINLALVETWYNDEDLRKVFGIRR